MDPTSKSTGTTILGKIKNGRQSRTIIIRNFVTNKSKLMMLTSISYISSPTVSLVSV